MTSVRDIMTPHAKFVGGDVSVEEAAVAMAEFDVGALPICDAEGHLEGMITDRDIAVNVVAIGRDPKTTTVGEIRRSNDMATIGADESLEATLRIMKDHSVRRLPVLDGRELIGMVSQADVAKHMPNDATGELVESISTAPASQQVT